MLEALMMAFIISYKIRLLENDKQQLGLQAIIDPLTQAYNRRHFFTQADFLIKHRLCEQRPLSVLMLDIDDFKSINDRYGHQAGDDVLKSLSKMLMDSIDEDQILARFGGEEFAILLPNHNQQQAEYFASLLLEKTQKIRVLANQQKLSITFSIGVAEMFEGTAIESALNRADKALYLAKSKGKNQVASL